MVNTGADEFMETSNSQFSINNSELAITNSKLPILNSQFPTPNSQFPIPNPQSPTPNSQLLFIDTDMYVMKVWCEHVFGKCHQFILDEIVQRRYHLYLFCNIDLPWVADELREYPDEGPRSELYSIYKDLLVNQQTPWADISGSYQNRLDTAIAAVDALLNIDPDVQVSDTTEAH